MLEAGKDSHDAASSEEKAFETHSENVDTDTIGAPRLTSLV